jgi:hypothetical protein
VSVAETRYQGPVTKYRHIVFAAKISAVGIFAVGLEFFTHREIVLAVLLWVAAVALSLWPVKIDITEDAKPAAAKGEQASGKMHPLEEI